MSLSNISLILITLLFAFPSDSRADATLYDLVVGGTIKNLAKIYIITSNLPKIKAKYVKKITNMREEKFQKNYRKFYIVFEHLPPAIKQGYDFTPNTSRAELILAINHVSKKDLISIINKIPSEMITRQAKRYSQPKQVHGHDSVDEMFFWRRLVEKM
jgi:hypothetical protein